MYQRAKLLQRKLELGKNQGVTFFEQIITKAYYGKNLCRNLRFF